MEVLAARFKKSVKTCIIDRYIVYYVKFSEKLL